MIEKRVFFDFLLSILFGIFGLVLIIVAFRDLLIIADFRDLTVLSEHLWIKWKVLKFSRSLSYLFSGIGMIFLAFLMIRKGKKTFIYGTVFIGLGLIYYILGLTFLINPYIFLSLLIVLIAVFVFFVKKIVR